MAGRLLRYLPLMLVVVLLGVAALAAVGTGPRIGRVPITIPTIQVSHPPPPPQPSQPNPNSGQGQGQHGNSPPLWVTIVIVAGVLALLYGAIMLWLMLVVRDAVRTRRPRKRDAELPDDEPVSGPSAEDLRAAVRDSLAVLIDGDDPRAAVIACWLRLEQLAERSGVRRSAADVPGDLVARMLDGHLSAGGGTALRELTDVYRAARYSPHPVPEAARGTARDALDRLATELSAVSYT